MKIVDIRSKSKEELKETLKELKEKLVEKKQKVLLGKEKKLSDITMLRKDVARLSTVLREKEILEELN